MKKASKLASKPPQGPDFLSVAPHKTGSTWLYKMLQANSEIWLPPKKELWILNQLDASYWERWSHYLSRTGMPGNNLKYFQAYLRTWLQHGPLSKSSLLTLIWWGKFLTFPYKVSSYCHFFPKDSSKIRGDITPNYYFLKEDIVAQLSQSYPKLKILIVLRNPIERVWSYTKMQVQVFSGSRLEDYDEKQLLEVFDSIYAWWVPYDQTIRLWQKYFPDLMIAFYDLLETNPAKFLCNVFDFLDVTSNSFSGDLDKKINPSTSQELPPVLRSYLAVQYQEEIQRLTNTNIGEYPKTWR